MTRRLLRELREAFPEVTTDLVTSRSAPAGAKPVDVVTIGALALAVLPAAVPQLLAFLKDWVLRGHGRTVKIRVQQGKRTVDVEYDPTTISPDELSGLIQRFGAAPATKRGTR
ncbi:MAG: hypothetical protein ACREOQ_12670 [Gemmatimonadales bacterium]